MCAPHTCIHKHVHLPLKPLRAPALPAWDSLYPQVAGSPVRVLAAGLMGLSETLRQIPLPTLGGWHCLPTYVLSCHLTF